jgi:hypothetical protein
MCIIHKGFRGFRALSPASILGGKLIGLNPAIPYEIIHSTLAVIKFRTCTMKEKILEGKLNLYSSQGMEGGCLAIMDERFITYKLPLFGVTENREVWDINDISKFGLTSNPEIYMNNSWLPCPDPISFESDYRISTLFKGEEYGDFNADKRLMEKYNFKLKYTEEIANEKYGKGNWKFTGHHKDIVLNDGSKISLGGPICIPPRPYGIQKDGLTRVTVTWNNGMIEKQRLSKMEGHFTQIYQDMFVQNNDWKKYFTEKYYAELYRDEE